MRRLYSTGITKEVEKMSGVCNGNRLLGMVIFLLLMTLGSSGWAQQYPTKPITFILGLGAGGQTDIITRALANAASKTLGQPIVVLNKTGGGTSIGLIAVKESKPDGYTIGNLASGGIINPFLRKEPYNVVNDFTPIMSFSDSFGGVVVRTDSQWKSLKQMVDYARANPGKINYGTAGVGLVHHLVMEKLCFDEKIKMVNVPYKGGGELMISVLGGEVEAAAAAPDFVPHVKSGKARLLATYFPTRLPIFPESPTFLEQGYNIAVRNTTAIVGPKGLPRPIVEKLDHAFKKALDDPNFLASMKSFELGVRYQGPEELAKYIAEFIDTYGPIARKIGMKIF